MKKMLFTIAKKTTITLVLVSLAWTSVSPGLPAQAQFDEAGFINPNTSQSVGVDNSSDIGCNFKTLVTSGTGGTFALCLTNVVYVFTVGIGSGFAYVAAYFFDFAVQLSLNSAAYALGFIGQGWTTARDLANMSFLFILIYIAFVIMLEAETSDHVQTLAAVIVVALLVNFSFFFTRLAVDAGNIVSIQFYNAIQAPPISQGNQPGAASAVTSAASALGASNNTKDLTASIMGMLQLQNLFNTNSFQAFFKGGSTTGGQGAGFLVTTIALTFLYITAAIMFWLLTVMFIAAGVKFLVRIVVLWFLIIASPLAFVARAVPKFHTYFDQWLKLLINHSFYPAVFMFIFLILSNFANQLSCTTAGAVAQSGCVGLINGIFNGLQATSNSSSAVAAIGYAAANVGIRLGFVIIVLYIGLKASEAIGVMAGEQANKVGGWFGSKFIGTIGGAGRYTFGYAGNLAARSTRLRESAANNVFARTLWRGATGLSKASFDARAGAKALGLDLGKDVGTANKGGYKAAFDARVKKRTTEAEALAPTKNETGAAKIKAEEEHQQQLQQAQQSLRTADLAAQPTAQALQQAQQVAQQAAQQTTQAAQAETRAAQTLQAVAQNIQALVAAGVNQNDPQMQSARADQQRAQATLTNAQTAHQVAQAVGQAAQTALQNAEQTHAPNETALITATTQLENIKETINKRASEISGDKKAMQGSYAESLTTRSWKNLWQGPTAFIVLRSSREAAAKIRAGETGQSDTERIIEAVRNSGGGH